MSSTEQEVDENIDDTRGRHDLLAIMNDSRFMSEVLLAEYKSLRDEIGKKMDHRTSMVVCSVTVSSAVLGFGIERKSSSLLLVAPLVSLLLGIIILFHNNQIGRASDYLRQQIEGPLSAYYRQYVGWHNTMARPTYSIFSFSIPLFLIAIAPAVVAVPLALSSVDSPALTIPVLIVDSALLVVYVIQFAGRRLSRSRPVRFLSSKWHAKSRPSGCRTQV